MSIPRTHWIAALASMAAAVLSGCSVWWAPPISAGITVRDINERLRRVDADSRITAALRKNFPAGTSETTLVAALRQQGFYAPPGVSPGCVKLGAVVPDGPGPHPVCPLYDPMHSLWYSWNFPFRWYCGEQLSVIEGHRRTKRVFHLRSRRELARFQAQQCRWS